MSDGRGSRAEHPTRLGGDAHAAVRVRVTFGPARPPGPGASGPAARGAPPAPLTRSTAALLRRLLHACREGWVLDERVERAAAAVVADACRAGASPTALVRALRRTWADVPDLPRVPAQDARDLLNRLVTACVHASCVRGDGDAGDRAPPAANPRTGVATAPGPGGGIHL